MHGYGMHMACFVMSIARRVYSRLFPLHSFLEFFLTPVVVSGVFLTDYLDISLLCRARSCVPSPDACSARYASAPLAREQLMLHPRLALQA